MNYVCERAVGAARSCAFRSGKVILQQAVERAQMQKLLTSGKTDLLQKFISKKGRPFKAFLVLKEGDVGFEFEPRAAKGKSRVAKSPESKVAAPKLDFAGLPPLGKCPKCGGKVFDTETAYLCEKSQAEKRPCKFKISKVILQQPIDPSQAVRLLAEKKTELLHKFISKVGRPFPAYLIMDEEGKVTFEFPPRDSSPSAEQGTPA